MTDDSEGKIVIPLPDGIYVTDLLADDEGFGELMPEPTNPDALYVYIDGEWVDAYAPIESAYLDLFTPALTPPKGSARCVSFSDS